MKPVLIIQTGRAPHPIRGRHGDFPHWFRIGTRVAKHRLQVVEVIAGESLPQPHEVAGAIITGSAAMVTECAPWSEQTAGWIRSAMDIELPLFGVCYGHQLMAHALGGRVDYLPGGREIGTQPIDLLPVAAQDELFAMLPPSFRAHTTHEQSVLEVPRGSTVLARSARDPHQLLRYGPNAISTQFHPEFNAEVMRDYVKRKHVDLCREGADPKSIFNSVAATPLARQLLHRFSRMQGWV
jgi:GMP synthase (glutamine-hydrolysing)